MTFQSRLGGNQRGFSLQELLIVMGILVILVGMAGMFTEYASKERKRSERAMLVIVEALNRAREAARNGYEDEASRTVDLRKLNLPDGLQFATAVNPGDFPTDFPVLSPGSPIVFEVQTGRTQNNVWGVIVVTDAVRGTSGAVLVNQVPSPCQRFIRYSGEKQFSRLTTYAQ